MPFEIFDSSADDELNDALLAEEANWPEELSLLASQLSADAARLAAIYPVRAGAADRDSDIAPRPVIVAADHSELSTGWFSSMRGARWMAAAAVLALASLATFSAYPSLEPGAEDDPVVAPAVQVAVNADSGAAAAQDAAMQFEETGFENLSSPAQEALLDLFEDDQLAQASLSI